MTSTLLRAQDIDIATQNRNPIQTAALLVFNANLKKTLEAETDANWETQKRYIP